MNLLEQHEPHCQLPDGPCCRRGKWRDIEEPAPIAIAAVVGGFVRDASAVADKPTGEKLDLGVKRALVETRLLPPRVGECGSESRALTGRHGMTCSLAPAHTGRHSRMIVDMLFEWEDGGLPNPVAPQFVGPDGSFTV